MKTLRDFINIVEARLDDPTVSYSQDDTKVTATITSHLSGKYTKLANNLQRIDQLTEELKSLQAEVKDQQREQVAELFDAEDAVFTRVVETKSVIFTLSKDPKATEAPQYKKILEEFETMLTPELVKVLHALKKQHVTITQKAPSLKYTMKSEAIGEDTGGVAELVAKVNRWLPKFDQKLDRLDSMISAAKSASY